MAKFSMKKGGKEVGPASVYAKPHGEAAKKSKPVDPNKLKADELSPRIQDVPRVSMGDPAAVDVKGNGIKIRGTGAATKGVMARGPMA
jgi:hypothetical protein